jgi:hypothetical protein
MKKLYPYILLSLLLVIIACEEGTYNYAADETNSTGTAGSLARFTISGNYLYTVDPEKLKTFNISDEQNPALVGETYVNFGVETIFPYGEFLFLGTSQGVYVYSVATPASPQYISMFTHVQSCDPVVVSGNYAYSTLNSAGPCGRGFNQLDIIDVSNPQNPYLVNTLQMESPKGLGVSGSLLFICDEGLKIYSLTNPAEPELLRVINDIDPVDVIPLDSILLVATELGMAEYSIDNDNTIHLLSILYSTKLISYEKN